jgi:hypothetical protein
MASVTGFVPLVPNNKTLKRAEFALLRLLLFSNYRVWCEKWLANQVLMSLQDCKKYKGL